MRRELGEVMSSLVARPRRRPVLAVIDGNAGLRTARQAEGPGIESPRGPAHKLRNRQAKAVLLLLFGLRRSGQLKLRALGGYRDLGHVQRAAEVTSAAG